jgi:hypothetical protein
LNFSLFYQILIGKRFSKNSKRKWFRRVETIIKCARRLIFDDLLAVNPCGLQKSGEKVRFSKTHCEVQKQPNLDFSFRGINPSPLLISNLHMKALGLYPWPPGSSKSPIFPNFAIKVGDIPCDGKRNFK